MPKDLPIYELEYTSSGVGGRISSPKLRKSLGQAQDFSGLEADVKRYDLLLLVKRVGKGAGFSPRMIELLDYYMAYTRDVDWERGSRPIVYQSLAKTSLDLGVSERQVQRLEQLLFDAGALTWNDSGNHRRYGQRDPQSGKLVYAYGVDLTPLAYLQGDLQDRLHKKQLYDQAWLKTKREISSYRRQIKACMGELIEQGEPIDHFEHEYAKISMQIRTHIKLDKLRTLFDQHKDLFNQVNKAAIQAQKTHIRVDNDSHKTNIGSSKSDQRVSHYNSTTHKLSINSNTEITDRSELIKRNGLQDKVVANFDESLESPGGGETQGRGLEAGVEHITLKQALSVASSELREHIPITNRALSWEDLIEAAYKLKSELHISQKSWAYGCKLLGRSGAAVCVILTDRGRGRDEEPVRNPAAYFNGMLDKARAGELKLHASVFGLLEKKVYLGEGS